jgi:dipeptidyl aminopeptidase/acylaminoacyl peptidase
MNVPNNGSIFPVAILVHGYIPPSEYSTIAYTTRYADNLARSGYFVIHPNLRNHRPSDQGPDQFRVGYAVDILNLIAILTEQSRDPVGYLRRADASDINLWGHSMGGGIVLRTITVNNDPAIRSAVLYSSMSGDEVLNFERILFWSNGDDGQFEIEAPGVALEAISPIFHLERIKAPISIHHSDSDEQVPPEWSADLCQKLQAIDHPTECFTYTGLPHTFRGQGDALFMDRVTDFFNRH